MAAKQDFAVTLMKMLMAMIMVTRIMTSWISSS